MTFMNKKVKRIPSFAENIDIFKGSIVAGLRNVVPNGETVTFYLLTCFVDSQVLSTADKTTMNQAMNSSCLGTYSNRIDS